MTLPWVLFLFTWPFEATWQDPLSKIAQPGIGYPLKSITRTGNQLHRKSKIQNPKSKIQNPKEPEELPKGLQMMRHYRLKTKQNHRRVHRPRKSHVEISNAMSQNKTIDINPRPKITRRSYEYQVLKQNHRHIPETKIHT